MEHSDTGPVQDELGVFLENAHRTYPNWPISGAFEEFAQENRAHGATPQCAGDLLLAFLCLQGHRNALRELDLQLAQVCRKLRPRLLQDSDQQAELCQDVRVLLLCGSKTGVPYLRSYRGRAPLHIWLRTVLLRHELRQRRRWHRELLVDDVVELIDMPDAVGRPEQEFEWVKATYADAFRKAFQKSLSSLSPRDRIVVRYLLKDRMSAEQIGERLGVHRVTVARWLQKIRRELRTRTLETLQVALTVKPDEMNALMEWLHSRLEASFSGLSKGDS